MTSLRLSIGYLIAVGVGFIVSRLPVGAVLRPDLAGRKRAGLSISSAPDEQASPQDFATIAAAASFPKKLLLAVQSATADFLDVAFYLIIGTAAASVFNTAVNQEVILPLATDPLLSITAMMGLAALLAVCSTTDAFIAASFSTFSFASKLAFLLFGPVFDLKLFWLYGILFRRRFVTFLALGLFIVIALVCWRVDSLKLDQFQPLAAPAIAPSVSPP
jgi:uncharacterized membrane protein YraQ (UPF0718 family)